jgi:hypothetical protein
VILTHAYSFQLPEADVLGSCTTLWRDRANTVTATKGSVLMATTTSPIDGPVTNRLDIHLQDEGQPLPQSVQRSVA